MARTTKPPMPITALSPSRAKDFMQCPKLFFYKTILGLATPPSEATLRGTLAHYAFEHVFDHPIGERGPETALAYVEPAWRMVVEPLVERASVVPGSFEDRLRTAESRYREEHEPGSAKEDKLLAEAVAYRALIAPADEEAFLETVRTVVRGWYAMENPDKFTPTQRELYVRAQIGKATVHGFIDRLDSVPSAGNTVRTYVSDYKGLALDTPIPTPEGWTTMGRVCVGDFVLGTGGSPVMVTAKTPEQLLECFEVVFDGQHSIVADEVHMWPIIQEGQQIVVATRELSTMTMPVRLVDVSPVELSKREVTGDLYAMGRSVVQPEIVSPFNVAYKALLAVSRSTREDRLEFLRGAIAASSCSGVLEVGDVGVAELIEEILILEGCPPSRWTRDASVSRRSVPEQLNAAPTVVMSAPHVVTAVRPTRPVMTQCIAVDAADHLYLVGRSMAPTHNTGRKPSPRFTDDAFFQLEVYAALLQESEGVTTHQVRLVYTKENKSDGVLSRAITEETLARTRKKIVAVWEGIERAHRTDTWPTRKQTLCDWCHFQPVCPAWHPELEGMLAEEIEHRLTQD